MKKSSIKRKFLFIVLGMSLVSLTTFCAVAFRGSFTMRSKVQQLSARLGEFAISNSNLFLEQEAHDKLMTKAKSRSKIIDERLTAIEKDVLYFSRYIAKLYQKADRMPPMPIQFSTSDNYGKLAMQLRSANGKEDYPRIRQEAHLLGNITTAFESNGDDMEVLTVSLFLGTESGFMIVYGPFSSDQHQKFDPRDRPWYTGAKEAGESFWTAPYEDAASGKLVITCAHPFYGVDGEFKGVVGIDVVIDDLNSEIVDIDVGRHGYAFIIDSEQTLISSREFIKREGENEDDNGNGANKRRSAYWKGNPEYNETLKKVAAGETGFEKVNTQMGEKFIAYSQIPATGWSVVIVQPVSEIMELVTENSAAIEEMTQETLSVINSMIRVMLINFMFVLILAIVVIIYLAEKMSDKIIKPILTLEKCFERIASGELDTRVEIKTGDEIERLGGSVNSMAQKLKEYIENLQQVTAEKERIDVELNVATKIQANMLPSVFPPFPHHTEFDIYAAMLPAREVGGDFYDFFFVDKNTLAILVADVSGKGVPAALFMVIAKTLIRNTALSGKRPEVVFGTVNNMLYENNDAGMFVTAFMGYLNIKTGKFTYTNAGHTPPILRSGGCSKLLKMRPGLILAAFESKLYDQDEIMLQRGDELFLYTDGITEAMNKEKTLFGNERMLEAANNNPDVPLKDLTLLMKHEIDKFAEGAEQSDDITMLALRYIGPPAAGENDTMEKLSVEASLENLETALDFIAKNLEAANCQPKQRNQITIAIEEIFVNIAHYAYHPGVGEVTISVSTEEGEITIEFEDCGKPYNPLEKEDPDITEGVEEREMGGLGIFMVKNLMDAIEYRRNENKNLLTLRKKL
ncbi:MAG: SpoIIE family protein phosphatase [Chitinispirillales bacterium]|jgi:sigma-B regulation protein RsbU (phosphoserine phosphatase)|nr:SpoIIE family protein phosphatase [Chitinispirillales bacterium]